MLAALATLLPAAAIIPVHGVVQLGSNAGRAAIMLKHFPGGVLLPFLAGSAAGVALGGSVLTQLSPAVIKMGVGAFILYSLAAKPPRALARSAGDGGGGVELPDHVFRRDGAFRGGLRAQPRAGASRACGDAFGADDGAAPAEIARLRPARLRLRPVAASAGGADRLSGFLGTLVGRSVLTRIDERRFRLILNAILVALGLNLLVAGAQEQFGLTLLPSFGGATG
jgi:hypothetical protein